MSARSRRSNLNAVVKRERDHQHMETWRNHQKYYDHWRTTNSQYDVWTSPRYYRENTELVERLRTNQQRTHNLDVRRTKLRYMLHEEQMKYELELTINHVKSMSSNDHFANQTNIVPTNVLRTLNADLKLEEEERRRHQAELRLYDQWRCTDPHTKMLQRKFALNECKLSWLDQQIEKRLERDKSEEECRRILTEHSEEQERFKREQLEEERIAHEKRLELEQCLDLQCAELKTRRKEAEQLRQQETVYLQQQNDLEQLQSAHDIEMKRRANYECTLYNLRQYKYKLREKSRVFEENLHFDEQFLNRFDDHHLLQMEPQGQNDQLRKLLNQHKQLERDRQRCVEFLFDSEAQVLYKKQSEQWQYEETCRRQLLENVMETIGKQIQRRLSENRRVQSENMTEQDSVVAQIEMYNQKMAASSSSSSSSSSKPIALRNQTKNPDEIIEVTKQLNACLERKRIDDELERIHQDEERLQREILKIQQKQQRI